MLAKIETLFHLFGTYYQDIIVYGLIMVSAIIAVIGILKPILFNKISNKHVRKAALAFTNVATCFATVFVYFLVHGISFEYYTYTAIALAVTSIVVYWLYESTCLRDLIGLIGNLVLRKVLKVSVFALTTEDVEAVKVELKKTGDELKAYTKQELKKATTKIIEDKDLEKL